jgi:GTPase SAR1 family protein
MYVVNQIVEAIKHELLPTISSLFFWGLTLLFYILFVRLNNEYIFSNHTFGWPDFLKHADILFAAAAFFILDLRSFNKPLEKENYTSLVSDEADPDRVNDLIASESYVNIIAKTINETACLVSFSIGVFATWGSGKTDFLKRLKKVLSNNLDENKVLEFNPWKAVTTEGMLDDFFSLLSKELKSYDRSLATKLKSYSKKILSTGKEIQFRAIDAVMDEFIKDTSLQERYDKINELILSTGKRFIIVIDDLDRLSGKEIMEVLRIIRNSANFSNLFFVVALDHQYVIDVLHKTDLFSKEDQYLKKIFQLTLSLPQIRKETFSNEIIKILTYENMLPQDRDDIKRIVSQLGYDGRAAFFFGSAPTREEGILEQMFDNYRDIKRFCNSFKIHYNLLKGKVEVLDLFLLELIKNKCFPVYENIANRNLLTTNPNIHHTFMLDDVAWKKFLTSYHLDEYSSSSINNAITKLLYQSKEKNTRQFPFMYNFYLYFSYQLFNLISIEDFENAIQLPYTSLREKFDEWTTQGKLNDLQRILDNFIDFKDRGQYENFFRAYMLDTGKNVFLNRANKMILNDESQMNLYYKTPTEYLEFLKSILKDDSLPVNNRAFIANSLLRPGIYGTGKMLLPKEELQKIIYTLFDKFLSEQNGNFNDIYEFYLLNDVGRDTSNFIKILPEASERMLEYLQDSKNFEQYLKYLIRSYQQPTDGYFVFTPFTGEIFKNDWNEFKRRVKEHRSEDEAINNIKPIIEKYTDTYISGKDRFYLDGDEREKVLDHLRTTGQYAQ